MHDKQGTEVTLSEEPQWEAIGFSGWLYRVIRLVYDVPQNHPRVLAPFFGTFLGREVAVRHRQTGAILRLQPHDYISCELLNAGAYEPQTCSLALRLLSSGGTLIDVGANIGLISLPAAKLERTTVISVDGSVPALARLWQNSLLSRADLSVVAGLVSAEYGLLQLQIPTATNLGSARISHQASERQLNAAGVVTLAELVGLSPSRAVQLLKIDAEGSEWSILQGITAEQVPSIRNIIVELWPDEPNSTRVLEHLCRIGYTVRTVTGEVISDLRDLPESNAWFAAGVA